MSTHRGQQPVVLGQFVLERGDEALSDEARVPIFGHVLAKGVDLAVQPADLSESQSQLHHRWRILSRMRLVEVEVAVSEVENTFL